ncbi:MAG: deoxyribose-phosphate aldolase [Oscillospiraceae bacterium]|nr:deoxyribose-phosphate aldolase [Oscillospiraceae bacterium]
MNANEILNKIDHTVLSATATTEDVKKICEEAVKYGTASVCIPPSYIKWARENFPSLNLCTVIGFPLGYNTTAVKVFETGNAVIDGADEIDMVINLGFVKDKKFDKITEEISAVKKACGGKLLKVIIETCYLTDDEKKELCKCVTDAGAEYIKTSTGFGTKGAELSDIEIFKDNIGENVKIKAAGGIRTKEDMENFIEAGCDRIGTSKASILFSE